MTDQLDFEARLAERLRAAAASASRPFDAAAIARQAVEAGGRRRAVGRLEWPPRRPPVGWLVVALLLAMAALGTVVGVRALLRDIGPGPLVWQPQRLAEDWPAPVRPEPLTGGEVVPMRLGEDARWDQERGLWGPFQSSDVLGDAGRDDVPWVDIAKVHLGGLTPHSFGIVLAGDMPQPIPNPEVAWIAYGIVLDTNDDGVADVRIGIDNMPSGEHRVWRTDLASGETRWSAGPPYGQVADAWHPGEGAWYPGREGGGFAAFWYPVQEDERPLRFYAWASMIERGRVVATDYAPDVGWLEEGTQPELTLVGPLWGMDSEFNGGNASIGQTLSFKADGRVYIDAGCRQGFADVAVEQGALRIGEPDLSENVCLDGGATARGDAFIEFLSADLLAYSIDDGILELRAGSEVLNFNAWLPPPLAP